MNYDFQKNSFLKLDDTTIKSKNFNIIRKTPEQIKEEMFKLKSKHNIKEEQKKEEKTSSLSDKLESINNIKRWK